MVQRWTFDTTVGLVPEHWVVPYNPDKMGPLFPDNNRTGKTTTAGRILVFEGARQPKPWSFSGTLRTQDHHENLRHWVYDIKQRVKITDHYGRVLIVALNSFEAEPVKAFNVPWKHSYTVSGLLLSVGAPSA